jgi:DNA ligase (NAD+)
MSKNNLVEKTYVFTGEFSFSRKEADQIIILQGGPISKTVSLRTSFLVSGNYPGSAEVMAKSLGVSIINETEFLRMAGGLL